MKKLFFAFVFLMVVGFGVQQAHALVTPNEPVLTNTGVILKQGSTGTTVTELQQTLIDKGYLLGKADGKFGLLTTNAVKAFQKANKLKVDGVVGAGTLLVLNDPSSGSTTGGTNTGTSSAGNGTNSNTNSNTNSKITKSETITLSSTKNKNILLKNYSCKDTVAKAKLGIWTGEALDEAKDALTSLSDVWTTTDGTLWTKEADKISVGQGWERMVVTIKEGGKDTVYSFGAKYKVGGSESDNAIYKSTDFVNWTYVGDMPDFSRYYDKSIVHFNGKFWAISSEEPNTSSDVVGVWSSSNGSSWKQELNDVPWDGNGRDTVTNGKGSYNSNSLGAFVIGKEMFYLVYNDNVMTIYSTTDGKKWTNQGALVDSSTSASFKIGTNTNPAPVTYNGEVYIYSTVPGTMSPITIKTKNGKKWVRVTSTEDRSNYTNGLKDTDYAPGYYSSDLVFNNKLWKIGGMNNTKGNDNAIYTSKDGADWKKMDVEGVSEFPGPADRQLSGAAVITGSMKMKATNLQIARKYNSTGWFTGSDETARNLGEWNLIANSEKNTKNTGPVSVASLSFVGNNYKSSLGGKEISSLETMENLTVYIDDVKVGSITKFKGPFFETTGSKLALPQTIKLDTPYTINQGQSVWVKLVADFPKPAFGNIEYRTFLNGITFKDGYTTPCLVYNNETTDGYFSVPGANLYYKDAKLPN